MMNQTTSPEPNMLSEQVTDYLKTEYTALRAELLKRVELQHQLISLALIAFGTFITVSIEGSATVSLAYPPLAMFLAVAWSQSDVRIRLIHLYIRNHTEEKLLSGGLGWEHARRSSSINRLGPLSFFASRGILIGTQLLAIMIFLLKSNFQLVDMVLLGIDILAVAFTLFIMRAHKVSVE